MKIIKYNKKNISINSTYLLKNKSAIIYFNIYQCINFNKK